MGYTRRQKRGGKGRRFFRFACGARTKVVLTLSVHARAAPRVVCTCPSCPLEPHAGPDLSNPSDKLSRGAGARGAKRAVRAADRRDHGRGVGGEGKGRGRRSEDEGQESTTDGGAGDGRAEQRACDTRVDVAKGWGCGNGMGRGRG